VQSERLAVGDAQEGLSILRWRRLTQTFGVIGEDSAPRHLTCICPLDYYSVATGDKFGNISVLRLPKDAKDDGQSATMKSDRMRALWEGGGSGGRAPAARLDSICHFHIGSAVTAIRSARMPGGADAILASTITGSVVALQPLASRRESGAISTLERFLRAQKLGLLNPVGRWHIAYRSAHVAVQRVVDGDFCERLLELPTSAQDAIAEDMGQDATEEIGAGRKATLRRIHRLRSRLLG